MCIAARVLPGAVNAISIEQTAVDLVFMIEPTQHEPIALKQACLLKIASAISSHWFALAL
jgi:hypothetical protein